MGLFDHIRRMASGSGSGQGAASAPTDGVVEHDLGKIAVTVLGVDDPFACEVRNGHCSPAYLRGEERLLSVELRIRHTGQTDEAVKVSSGKLQLFDDADHLHQDLGLDRRNRAPRIHESFVLPGGVVCGWVTFQLHWDRQPKRLQFFTGYLGEGVCCWDLPVWASEDWAVQRAEAAQRAVRAEADKQMIEKRRAVEAIERRAEVAREMLSRKADVAELERRASAAKAWIQQAERAATSPEEDTTGGGSPMRAPIEPTRVDAAGSGDVHPDSPALRHAFTQTDPSMAWTWMSPAGGEDDCELVVLSIEAGVVATAEDALRVLLKGLLCVVHEWPYALWEDDRLAMALREYRDEYDRWSVAGDPSAVHARLHDRCGETVASQRALDKRAAAAGVSEWELLGVRQPRMPCFPSVDTVVSLELEGLAYLRADHLVRWVCTEWNDTLGLYRDRDRWFLVRWSTSA